MEPEVPPISFAKVYALEAKYQAIATEYNELMERLNHTCVGKDNASAACVKAAQLNADMQTTLSELSETLKTTGAPEKKQSVFSQQMKLLTLADGLETDYTTLTADAADASVTTTMYQTRYLAWMLGFAFVGALIWQRRGK